jgi:hypothetical protein
MSSLVHHLIAPFYYYRLYRCFKCPTEVENYNQLLVHFAFKHKKKLVAQKYDAVKKKCRVCGTACRSLSACVMHLVIEHKILEDQVFVENLLLAARGVGSML